ncbi:MAG: hypothetical protein HYS13_17705 [Planctomycetia bacterium]|nr:hypothetical protein [Planctomycetia bacterium]
MAKPKTTGLGESLLLRRTDPPADRPRKPAKNGQERKEAPPIEPAGADDPAPADPLSTVHRAVPRDRTTLYLDQDVNDWLDLAARIERKQRSELASEILRKHLPRYRIEPEK